MTRRLRTVLLLAALFLALPATRLGAEPVGDLPRIPADAEAFLTFRPAELTAKLDAAVAQSAAKGAKDAAVVIGRTLYLHTPAGYGNSDLSAAVLRVVSSPKAGVTGTARNWATMTKLLELCG